jgi:glycosyltransferase involved in cell wall biosynthesis
MNPRSMNLAMIVPGGVDRSGERRVIPALLALIERLASRHTLRVFALRQEARPAQWQLSGATVQNIGGRFELVRTIAAVRAAHARQPFDIVQSIWAGQCAFAAVAAGRSLGIPAAVHIAGGELAAVPDIGYGGALRGYRRVLDRACLRRASAVTAASQPIIDSATALGVDVARIPLGVDLRAWPPRAPRRREPGACARLIHVASLNRVKDQPTLLRALALMATRHEFELDVIGEDTLGGVVQQLARELGLESRVRFHGFLTQRELRPLMEAAHVHVMSSRHEAGPLAALEAAVAGVPTVGTDVGHLHEWTPHAAATTPVRDAAALAAAIERLLADEELRLALAHAAAGIAMREDADHTAALFLAMYERLAGI